MMKSYAPSLIAQLHFFDKKFILYIDQGIWDKWEVVFTCYELGTLKCSPNQLDFEKYKTNSPHSLTSSFFHPL